MYRPLGSFTAVFRLGSRRVLTLAALWLLLYSSFTLFSPPLLDDADSVHAEVAREMVQGHDWITLYANGIRYLEKAPLLYWSMAASFTLFGPQDWAARLPLALATLALFLVVYSTGRRLFASDTAGFYAALILLTSFGIFIYSRILIPDVIVCLWLSLAMLFFWISLEQPQPSRATAWGFAAACALGVLTKGLIGVVFPLGIVFSFLLLNRNLGHLKRWHPVSSLLLFLIIALPWHIAAGIANPSQGQVHGFFWFYFINEHLLRYLNRRVPRDYDTVPLLLFWALLGAFLVPWIAFVFRALVPVRMRSSLRRVRLPRHDQAWNLLAIWAAFVMLFFSFSTRQEYYSLPALPPLALMIGGWLNREEKCSARDPRRIAGRRIAVVLFLLGAAASVIATYLAIRARTPLPGTDLSTLLTQNPGDYALSLGHFLDLSVRSMGAFRVPLILTAIALPVGTFANMIFRSINLIRLGNYTLVAMMVVMLIAAHSALVTFSPVLSSKALADAIGHVCIPPTWSRSTANTRPARRWAFTYAVRSAFSTAVLPISGTVHSSATRRGSSTTTLHSASSGMVQNEFSSGLRRIMFRPCRPRPMQSRKAEEKRSSAINPNPQENEPGCPTFAEARSRTLSY